MKHIAIVFILLLATLGIYFALTVEGNFIKAISWVYGIFMVLCANDISNTKSNS